MTCEVAASNMTTHTTAIICKGSGRPLSMDGMGMALLVFSVVLCSCTLHHAGCPPQIHKIRSSAPPVLSVVCLTRTVWDDGKESWMLDSTRIHRFGAWMMSLVASKNGIQERTVSWKRRANSIKHTRICRQGVFATHCLASALDASAGPCWLLGHDCPDWCTSNLNEFKGFWGSRLLKAALKSKGPWRA